MGQFDWDFFIPHLVHPLKVAVIEAMQWIAVPVSPRELDRCFNEDFGVSLISYHVRSLADLGVVEMVRQEPVRGALQNFYALTARDCANPEQPCE